MEKGIGYDAHMDRLQKVFARLKIVRDEYAKGNMTLEEFLTETMEKNVEIKKLVDEIKGAITGFYNSAQSEYRLC